MNRFQPLGQSPEEMLDDLEKLAEALIVRGYDSVRIICTKKLPDDTEMLTCGAGNFYAQMGATKEWLGRQQARNDEHARMRAREELGDEEEAEGTAG